MTRAALARYAAIALAASTTIGVATTAAVGNGPSFAGLPTKTIPTVPPDGAIDGTTADTRDPPATGIALRAHAQLTEILAAVQSATGPTSDVVVELRALADVPDNIASPAGSTIRRFGVDYFPLDGYFVATATFTSDATPEDAVTFYQATLAAAGFVPTADSGRRDGDPPTQTLRFETPTSEYDDAHVEVTVIDTDDDDVVIELTITDAAEPDVLQAFTGWPAGMPTLGEGEPIEAGLHAEWEQPQLSVTLTTRFAFDGSSPAELAAAIRTAMPAGPFVLDDDDDPASMTIALRHPLIDDISCVITGTDERGAVLELSGTVTL
jgi:hypothetical protein